MKRNPADPQGKVLRLKSFGPAIACFVIVFILIVMPDDKLPSTKKWWIDISYPDKWVHGIMFAVLTFLFLLPVAESSLFRKIKRHYFIRIGLSAVIWGITTEYIQKFFVPSRGFDLLDWAADCIGVLVAVIYCRKFHLR